MLAGSVRCRYRQNMETSGTANLDHMPNLWLDLVCVASNVRQ